MYSSPNSLHSIDQWKGFFDNNKGDEDFFKHIAVSSGISDKDFDKIDQWKGFFDNNKEDEDFFKHIAVSSGISDKDFDKLRAICKEVPSLDYICIDVANGYSESFTEFIRRVRENFPRHTIMAGNVVTGEMLRAICKEVPSLDYICIDVANGYSESFTEFIRRVRENFPRHTIMAGNVVTGEMVEELLLSGADIIKVEIELHYNIINSSKGSIQVGIGPGSVCTTRKKTGVGYPQLSAVLECADAAHGLRGHVISDGGCTNSGDVAKAFGAGADFVMIGGLLAGHDQCGGDIIEQNGRKFKLFYGMSSDTAMNKHHGSVAEYRASEGRTTTIPYRGDVNCTVLDILGGLRSACTYTGSAKLKELSKRTTFIRVTQQTNDMYVPYEIQSKV
ncbi:unnamed protein product [Strongylus vulgaris]|uniref:GMP reductase n=1 Tax=Strongylus vulgaris TaxID=40348 RepID=A0A3P7JMT2_STRVU|nr:unnamed protein product [Strongylus vulgaris]